MLQFLRPLLVPSGLVSETCADTLLGLDFGDDDFMPCAKMSISKAVGYAIILGAAIVKLPIILNMIKDSTAAGISGIALTLETTMYMSTVLYNIKTEAFQHLW